MEPLDPLDQLLRARPPDPWPDRARAYLVARWPWVVAAVVIGVIAAVVVLVGGDGAPPVVSLPKAGSEPAGGVGTTSVGQPVAAPGASAAGATTTTASGSLVVHVAGAVNAPGLVTLPVGARVADAVAAAGGLGPEADGDRVNLAAPLTDGVRVFIPVRGQPDPPAAAVVSGAPAASDPGSASASTGAPIDLNTATETELDALPGVGPSTAAAIVAYRSEHGRFRTVDELQEVRGIGPAKFEAIESLVAAG